MPQQGGNLSNQIKATLFNRFQQQQNIGGWQSMLPPGERVNLVIQLYVKMCENRSDCIHLTYPRSTSLNLAQPTMGHENALKSALALENERFTRSANKVSDFFLFIAHRFD
jgi:hypothetical protein